MRNRQLGKALTIIVTVALTAEIIASAFSAVEISAATGTERSVNIPITVTTGTQTDAITDEEENKVNNPSKYDEVKGTDSEDGSNNNDSEKNDSQGAESEAEEIIWEEVHIATADDLIAFAKNCRLDSYSSNKNVYLDSDISMTDSTFEGIPYFNGHFYGQGKTVNNIRIDSDKSYLGFFSRLDTDAVVSELNVVGYLKPSRTQTIIGGIAGDNKGVIMKCSFKGTVRGEDYVGGIAGINELTGVIVDSKSIGSVSGTHFTGGIAGENMGNIFNSTNEAGVNTTEETTTVSIEDINIDTILAGVGIGDADKDEAEASALINGVVDMGGIAGVSIGVIQNCINKGNIGYKKVGYNVGGIAGRQSGYIYSCENTGTILGRKDVGGIVGQAEPYVTIDFANDITSQLSDNIEKLHDILEVTLDDADASSDTISARLAVIKSFTDGALSDTRYLENETIDWANGVMATANEAISRADYIMDQAAKKDGVMDKTNAAVSDAKTAMNQFDKTVNDLNIEQYMTESQKEEYNAAKKNIEDASKEYEGYEKEVDKKAAYNYSLHYYINQSEYDKTSNPSKDLDRDENNVKYKNGDTVIFDKNGSGTASPSTSPENAGKSWDVSENSVNVNSNTKYGVEGKWVHHPDSGDDVALGSTDDSNQNTLDASLTEAATKGAAEIAKAYADEKYKANNSGKKYTDIIKDNGEIIADILATVSPEMTDATRTDADKALKSLESSMSNLESAGGQAKSIIKDINGKSDLSLPTFSDAYKLHANSLTNNIQGMSDNFGLLSSEMNGASDQMVGDLKGVNDQFNVIMLLFTDAIDGVLDNDYSNSYVDNSLEVCKSTTDATVDSCTNNGTVDGSINVSGICGTMAIEYDFDLESDVTGVRDAAMNKSYQTKCVLRDVINNGLVTAQKDYAGGVCGLQELGTITGGQNYAKIASSTASYVGGIAGSSVSAIVNSFAKCTLSGTSYVGGITGDGARIYDSLSMVTITDASAWYGAISGHVDDDADICNNFYISDELAGIDRVSYAGVAEPIAYNEIADKFAVIPSFFHNIVIDYMLDEDPDSEDDELILIRRMTYNYGQNISEEEYPEIPAKDGYYGVWDIIPVSDLQNDMTITATYVRNNTTLAGEIVRSSNRSAILVDGKFKEGDKLNAMLCTNEAEALPDMKEFWEISIPDDGQTSHMVRYMRPDNLDEWPDIYIYRNGNWELIASEDIGNMGTYKTFYVDGNNIKLQMVYAKGHKQKIKKILIYIAAVLGLALLIFIFVTIIRTRKKVQKKVQEHAHAIKERAEAREPAIKFVEESDLVDLEEDDDELETVTDPKTESETELETKKD